jgi:uncharacterized protein YjaZ
MAIVSTEDWLTNYLQNKGAVKDKNMDLQRTTLCMHLKPYFEDAQLDEIQNHLHQYGLFIPHPTDKARINHMVENDLWSLAEKELDNLKKEWEGPDIPVFILPSNSQNEMLRLEFNGKSGLSYQDKVFLFVSDQTTREELKALLTHEYNHVCRLQYLNQPEDEIALMDSIVLEGLAEKAVLDYVGYNYVSNWATMYTYNFALWGWRTWIKPNITIKKVEDRHHHLLYGGGLIPKWLGYYAGYQVVMSYAKHNNAEMNELLRTPAKKIIEGSEFLL